MVDEVPLKVEERASSKKTYVCRCAYAVDAHESILFTSAERASRAQEREG